nr:tripartite tricarboxylate transporter substrate binding protein [Pseudomonas sp.]
MNKLYKAVGALFAAASLVSVATAAEPYPSKSIRIVAPVSAGGTVDFIARLLAHEFSTSMGQSVIVENKPGSGGIVGGSDVLHSAPDGYTLLVGIPSFATLPHMMESVPYRFSDFTPIGLVAGTSNVLLAGPASDITSLQDLVTKAKANPGKLTFATTGNGGSPHLAGELFHEMAQIKMTHIPYKGSAPALNNLLGGHVDVMYDNLPSALPHIKGGKVRALAVTSSSRIPELPDVPTFSESGYANYEVDAAWGLLAPKGTPADVVQKLEEEIRKALAAPGVKETLAVRGLTSLGTDGVEYTKLIAAEEAKWAPVIKQVGIKF